MSRVLALLIMLFVFGFATLVDIKAGASGDTIETIRSQYASINRNVRRYKKVKKELSGYSTEGGTMEAYVDGASVKKIVAHFYGETGRADEEYYFWNDQLIFVFRKDSTYSRPLSGKVVSTKENRFYFNNGHMIRWLNESGKQVPSSNSGYSEKQNEYLESSRKFTELAGT